MQGIIVVGYPFMKPATMDIQVCETVKSIRPIKLMSLPTSHPSEDARMARWQQNRAA